MAQDYFTKNGESSSTGEGSSNARHDERDPQENQPAWATPQYLTVGNGARSSAAEALVSSLNRDSGYGDSVSGDSAMAGGDLTDWRAGLLEDQPSPAPSSTLACEFVPLKARDTELTILNSLG
jgi:mitofusin